MTPKLSSTEHMILRMALLSYKNKMIEWSRLEKNVKFKAVWAENADTAGILLEKFGGNRGES